MYEVPILLEPAHCCFWLNYYAIRYIVRVKQHTQSDAEYCEIFPLNCCHTTVVDARGCTQHIPV